MYQSKQLQIYKGEGQKAKLNSHLCMYVCMHVTNFFFVIDEEIVEDWDGKA